MTHPLHEHRDPVVQDSHAPTGARSRAMHALSARAAQGRFVLQSCTVCAAVAWPPRDACPQCWGELAWADQPVGACVVNQTTIHVSTDPYFRAHLPWRMGTVQLDAGPVAMAHLYGALKPGMRAVMRLMLDRGGNAALYALPAEGMSDMNDLQSDAQWREFIIPVAGRTVLVSDAAQATGRAMVRALIQAGAGLVVAGLSAPASATDADDAILGHETVRIVRLDLTDAASVAAALGMMERPLDIVINTARHVRGGGVSRDAALAKQQFAMEVSAMGLSRLAGAAAPLLAGRPQGAFVDLISVQALAGDAGFAGFAAAEAARLSLVQSLRHEMRATGVRVLTVFTGPTDDADHQSLPPPKVAPARLAAAVVDALAQGREQTCVGDVAKDAMARWLVDPALFIREINL
ncbi:SDR family NAD(P)-dependent oxidoreductase [Novosphingobium sp. KACC 22771]|uniref:SDR family NAD(P)-dependent oxidoreductase n=1 Tax=Novosphingobium sp. KACC 22771 TaxID=3025670 RepID=UPI00236543D5|nr:SDR family NAD(P)-dependent oxidoreductase [Novosphingobium sp. KACC 22771]WDF74980.1 SDR family NAD(P)-dependent oxidoreductase [Novosphingobium sp. KACC 22771]